MFPENTSTLSQEQTESKKMTWGGGGGGDGGGTPFFPQMTKHVRLNALKGIVHPKMKIVSSFTHPQVDPNLYECVCSAEHKGRYSEECGKQSSSGAPLTSIVFFSP